MKKICYSFFVIFVFMFSIFILSNDVYASGIDVDGLFGGKKDVNGPSVDNESDGILDQNVNEGLDTTEKIIQKFLGNLIATMFVFGTGVSITLLIVFGIKYIMGSIEEKAEIKKHLTAYVIGVVVFYASATILYVFQEFVYGNLNG